MERIKVIGMAVVMIVAGATATLVPRQAEAVPKCTVTYGWEVFQLEYKQCRKKTTTCCAFYDSWCSTSIEVDRNDCKPWWPLPPLTPYPG